MSQLRVGTILGASIVVYLLLEEASAHGRLARVGWLAAALALVSLLGARLARGAVATEETGARRVAAAFPFAAMMFASRVAVSPSLAAAVVDATADVVLGALLLDLAAQVPDAERPLSRMRAAGIALACVALGLSVLGVLAEHGVVRLISPRYAVAARSFLVASVMMACIVRLVRERISASATALAAHAWGLLGLIPAVLLFLGAFVELPRLGLSGGGRGLQLIPLALGLLGLLLGHVAMVDPSRRIEAAPVSRRVSEWAFSLVLISSGVLAMVPRMPRDPLAWVLLVLGAIALSTLLRRLARPVVRRLVAPFGGRLLDAIREARSRAAVAGTLDEVVTALLVPLRDASSDVDAEPRLLLVDPELTFRIDGAGIARSKSEPLNPTLLRHAAEQRGLVVFGELDAQVVRRPEVRPLHDALASLDALCVVPIGSAESLDALLVVPRGGRRTAPSLEELAALEDLARTLSPFLALACAHLRAEARIARLSFERDRADESAEASRDESARLRTEVRALRSARGTAGASSTVVAYSPAQAELERAILAVAPTQTPVTLVAEPGSHVDRLARRIHDASGVADGPFVLADCAAIREDEAELAFFGREGDPTNPGLLRLADHGTLLLADVVALPLPVQRAIAEALASRGARAVGSHAIYGFDLRVIATNRLPLEQGIASGALDADLGRRIAQAEFRVPPLRERLEDLPSLALLAIDQAVRRRGRSPVGLEAGALDALLAHPFPNNLRELEVAVERAVEQTDGPTISAETMLRALSGDVAPLESSDGHPLDGTLVDIERKALRRALERAQGNKSEAARALGIARTTFLDKLRRFGLEELGSVPPPRDPGA